MAIMPVVAGAFDIHYCLHPIRPDRGFAMRHMHWPMPRDVMLRIRMESWIDWPNRCHGAGGEGIARPARCSVVFKHLSTCTI